jgi:hypothetical protein
VPKHDYSKTFAFEFMRLFKRIFDNGLDPDYVIGLSFRVGEDQSIISDGSSV